MSEKMTFKNLGLTDRLLDAINKKGFEEPTAIQAMTIPVMLKGEANIIAQAQTGTGKTAAFGLPLIEMIDTGCKELQALILVPTRELAIQVSEEINSLKADRNLRVVPIYGGQSIGQQLRRLHEGVQIVVGTPGRIIDHINRKTLNLGDIEHLILDEADEMLNMGFIDDIEEIMKSTNPDRRTLLFSATMPKRIKDLAHKYMDGYTLLKAEKEPLVTNLTEQIYFEVRASDKFEALCRIIDMETRFYGLIFCRTKVDVDALVSHLRDRGYDADAIHGDITQVQREKTLNQFKKQNINILVATDVAARGIDVNNLTHVINYALPHNPESYVHRIGRTGRAGNQGTAITFITPSEYKRLMFIQRMAKADIKKSQVPKVKEIIKAKRRKIFEDLSEILQHEIDSSYTEWAQRLLQDREPAEMLAALLKYSFEEELSMDGYGEIGEVGRNSRSVDRQGKTRLFVALGRKDRVSPRRLTDLIMSRVDIQNREIGDIQIMDKFTFITVPFEKAEEIIESFRQKGRKPLITHVKKNGGRR
ncbi:MAG: DEAD/DEAH box helicase [Fibrobacterota bacterium]